MVRVGIMLINIQTGPHVILPISHERLRYEVKIKWFSIFLPISLMLVVFLFSFAGEICMCGAQSYD